MLQWFWCCWLFLWLRLKPLLEVPKNVSMLEKPCRKRNYQEPQKCILSKCTCLLPTYDWGKPTFRSKNEDSGFNVWFRKLNVKKHVSLLLTKQWKYHQKVTSLSCKVTCLDFRQRQKCLLICVSPTGAWKLLWKHWHSHSKVALLSLSITEFPL